MRTADTRPLSDEQLELAHAHWRAANYLSVGQIYLLDNPLLREPLKREHIKPRLLGHWGTTPGLNLIYTHCNRLIREQDLDMMYVIGPGHGGPAIVAQTWLEGSWTDTYPGTGMDERGMQRLFKQFSFPGGIPSHVAPEVPGSIHEGGELGYSLSHAVGAAFDNPDLIVTAVVGDGEAETGPLATSWNGGHFLNPARDGAILPILHLNGYKIANPTVLARIPEDDLESMLRGYGWDPVLVAGDDPADVHQQIAGALEECVARIKAIQQAARSGTKRGGDSVRWPMIVMRTPKGWTGPEEVDGVPVENTWRSHQVPLAGVRDNDEHREQLEAWLRSYRPEELFDDNGTPIEALRAWAPTGSRRMGSNPHTNGGLVSRPLRLPDPRDYAVEVTEHGTGQSEATRQTGAYLRDVIRANPDNVRLFGPDEVESNRLSAALEATDKAWELERYDTDAHLGPDGRIMEILSEHTCQGWLEGYTLTGRHGLFTSYEAFIHIVDSMFNQHAKWLKTIRELDWRRPIPSLNYLLSSHVWRQDHNGFSHQDPGFIDHVVNKKAEVIRVYLPPDANTLLWTMDLGLGEQRRGRPAGRDGVRRRRPDARDDGRRTHPAGEAAGPQGARGQRRGPDAAPAGVRAPARAQRAGVRRDLRHRRADHLRLPRLPVADPPADLPPHQPRAPPRARLQGGRYDDHAVRHGGPQRHGPVPPRHRRHRPGAGPREARRCPPAGDAGPPHPPPGLRQRVRRRHAGDHRLAVDPERAQGLRRELTADPHGVPCAGVERAA
jgi:xylulose-5-phosphate/fructose-6-phosphate phosphoketolase